MMKLLKLKLLGSVVIILVMLICLLLYFRIEGAWGFPTIECVMNNAGGMEKYHYLYFKNGKIYYYIKAIDYSAKPPIQTKESRLIGVYSKIHFNEYSVTFTRNAPLPFCAFPSAMVNVSPYKIQFKFENAPEEVQHIYLTREIFFDWEPQNAESIITHPKKEK